MLRLPPFVWGVLLAACNTSGGSVAPPKLHPVSYWSVTVFPNDRYECPIYDQFANPASDAARLTITAPGQVTLETLTSVHEGSGYKLTGRLSDGELHLRSNDIEYQGSLADGTLELRGFFNDRKCSATIRGVQYPGPAICEVTSEEEENDIAAHVAAAVKDSNLRKVRAFFENTEFRRQFKALAAVTQNGELELDGQLISTYWPWFWFSDGSRMELLNLDSGKTFPEFQLEGAGGWLLEGNRDFGFTLILDGAWKLHSDSYVTPVGEFHLWNSGSYASYSVQDHDVVTPYPTIEYERRSYSVTRTQSGVDLHNGAISKSFSSAFVRAYCPYAGSRLLRIFPDLQPGMGICNVGSGLGYFWQCVVE